MTVSNSPPGSLNAYNAVSSTSTTSFLVHGIGPPGTLDQTLMCFETIPEPGTLLLLGSGIGGLVLFGRTKRR